LRLAKPAIDIGLFTTQREAMLRFWQETVGLPFDEALPVGGGVHQLRHRIGDSILKINHVRGALADAPPSGYRRLSIARDDLRTPVELTDPDGNLVRLVPAGFDGVGQLALELAVRDATTTADFYGRVLALEALGHHRFRCGASIVTLREDRTAALDPPMSARGYRYTTIQVFDVVGEHGGILARGGREGRPPVRLGEVAYISFVRDPDGNWIEISQRKSLTGSLE
jgi:catechol 2,3-dioxygenase-like lactoylglutathione lyase family enzyme